MDAAVKAQLAARAAVEPIAEFAGSKGKTVTAAYEHPFVVRLTHWLNAIALFVLIPSGLRIFRAFPSFGPKIPQENLVAVPPALTIGNGLAGALQWHFTLIGIVAGSGALDLHCLPFS